MIQNHIVGNMSHVPCIFRDTSEKASSSVVDSVGDALYMILTERDRYPVNFKEGACFIYLFVVRCCKTFLRSIYYLLYIFTIEEYKLFLIIERTRTIYSPLLIRMDTTKFHVFI